ncbi:hypothetical protein [Egicoccus sp. AB-alg6-2]|uniref:MinD/ParA family ATP-binding protein n=1 Tax=Egicoccus sp. AB-alg6-2 TaxID=3242692 RepID=UPI00359DFE7D
MTSRALPPTHRSRTPLWLLEGLDIVQRRARVLRAVVAGICVVGLLLALVAPGIVPPTWLVGAAVALAALLLGLAVAIAVDTADLTLRGPRHVRAAGGELVAVLPTEATPDDAEKLATAVLDAREGGGKLILGIAAAGRDGRRAATLTDTLAIALARQGVSVLRLDLASGRQDRPGLVEVLRGQHRLTSAVDFEPGGLNLARLGPGRDLNAALEGLPALPSRLPRDLDVLLVALPTAASRPSMQAASALNHALVLGERDVTSRVDLIAGLDALEAVGIGAQVVLLDDVIAARLAPKPAADVDGATDGGAAVEADAGRTDAAASRDQGGTDAGNAEAAGPRATVPTVPDPAPTIPDPDPDTDPFGPEPDPFEPDPAPMEPDPVPTEPEPAPMEPDPSPYVPQPEQPVPAPAEPQPEPTARPEPTAAARPEPAAAATPQPEPTAARLQPEPTAATGPQPEPTAARLQPEPTAATGPQPEPTSRPRPEQARTGSSALAPQPDHAREAARLERERTGSTAMSADDTHPTTRMRPVSSDDPFGPDDDPLRTTAQLAVLLDDLASRDER